MKHVCFFCPPPLLSTLTPPSNLVGTYNNQYMVLDRNKVKLGHSIGDGTLTVVEQIPGLVEYSDQTQALRRGNDTSFFLVSTPGFIWRISLLWFHVCTVGYWPSYNVPFHPKIYTLSGYGEMWEEYGEDFSYDLCPRAKIFRRDQADVKDLDSLKHIMRFNGAWPCLNLGKSTTHIELVLPKVTIENLVKSTLFIDYKFNKKVMTTKI